MHANKHARGHLLPPPITPRALVDISPSNPALRSGTLHEPEALSLCWIRMKVPLNQLKHRLFIQNRIQKSERLLSLSVGSLENPVGRNVNR